MLDGVEVQEPGMEDRLTDKVGRIEFGPHRIIDCKRGVDPREIRDIVRVGRGVLAQAESHEVPETTLAVRLAEEISRLRQGLERIAKLKCIGGESRDCPCGGCIARRTLGGQDA